MFDEKITKISQVTGEVTFFLRDLGFSNYMIIKMFDTYRGSIIQLILDNPYFLLLDFSSIGFKKVDEIAEKLDFSKDCQFRLEAGIKYVISKFLGNGDTFVEKDILVESTSTFLEVDTDKVLDALEDLAISGSIKIEKLSGKVLCYFYPYYQAECKLANRLIELDKQVKNLRITNIPEIIDEYENRNNIKLSGYQKLAIRSIFSTGVSIITGGPGTGKTTIIDCISYILDKYQVKYVLSAPTGRASKRIMESTKRYAQTVHRMLGYSYDESRKKMMFSINKDNPLNYDVIIVDEASMLDLLISSALVDAINDGARLVLVGDSNQLPSVGAGNVLSDLISSDVFSVNRLSRIYRQDEESDIVECSYKINKGEYPNFNKIELEDVFSSTDDLLFIEERKQEDILENILKIVSKIESNNVQVLTPSKKGILGSESLNGRLQEIFNPKSDDKDEIKFGSKIFRINDRVMQIKNNYSIEYVTVKDNYVFRANNPLKSFSEGDDVAKGQGVFNGEIGVITNINKEENTLTILYDEERFVTYNYTDLEELDLAYAITIHKSQGSEFKYVIIPVSWFPPILSTRSLIYTGLTRGKEKVILIGEEKYVFLMVDNDSSYSRNSGLKDRLINII